MKRLVLLFATFAVVPAAGAAPTGSVPTFTKDVAPIVFDKCAACHRKGEVAPMTLTSYEEVRPWAKVIKNKVMAREMPPWFADPAHTLKMRNDRSLSQAQIDTIVAWVDGGAPKGTDADLPPLPKFAEGWTAGREPDAILEMPVEFSIPAEGELGVQMFYSRCRGAKTALPRRSRFVPAIAASSTTPASSSSTSPKARRSWTDGS